MSEHIKTGLEIWKYLNETHNSKEGKKKWISLPWLRDEKINDLKKSMHRLNTGRSNNPVSNRAIRIIDDWFKSLLEEK